MCNIVVDGSLLYLPKSLTPKAGIDISNWIYRNCLVSIAQMTLELILRLLESLAVVCVSGKN